MSFPSFIPAKRQAMLSYKTRFKMMGTIIDLTIHHPNGESLLTDCYLQLERFAQRFTVNQSHSELMNVNHNAGIRPVRVKADLYELIKKAKTASMDNSNPFNIAIGPLIKTWRIGFNDAKLPTDRELMNILDIVDPSHIVLDDLYQTIFLTKPGMEIDLGAIAKGYFADQIKEYLVSHNVKHGCINLGGNVLTIGYAPNNAIQAWNVGIQDPLSPRGEVCRIVPLQGQSMVTSGINERYLEHGGLRYHHLIDAKTGKPINTDIASVTIISNLSVDGEIWSTAGFLSTVDDSLAYLNKQLDIEAVLISETGVVSITNGLKDDGRYIQKK